MFKHFSTFSICSASLSGGITFNGSQQTTGSLGAVSAPGLQSDCAPGQELRTGRAASGVCQPGPGSRARDGPAGGYGGYR